MPVQMVQIGYVWMCMFHSPVYMEMGVRFSRRVLRTVLMLMMFVVYVGMRMRHGFVDVFVFVALSEMKPDT